MLNWNPQRWPYPFWQAGQSSPAGPVRAIPGNSQGNPSAAPSTEGPPTSGYGTMRVVVSYLVPPQPFIDDEVLPNAANFGLDDDLDASLLLRQIGQGLRPAGVLDDADGLFFIGVDDDSLPLMAFFTMWQYTYPTFPFLDDDPWTLFTGINIDESYVYVIPPIRYATGTAVTDDEVLPGAVFIALDEDYWSPQFTMMIANVMANASVSDTDAWVTFVPPPPTKAKGLPLLGAGS